VILALVCHCLALKRAALNPFKLEPSPLAAWYNVPLRQQASGSGGTDGVDGYSNKYGMGPDWRGERG
jgi:hypothetical protein